MADKNVIALFENMNSNYEDFRHLMFDTAMGVQKVEKTVADAKIREVFNEILGFACDYKPNKIELRRAIRKHKTEIFEVIEETVQNLLVSGWGENPFFNQFVEIKNFADGDTNSFWTEDDVILTVSEIAGGHHDLFRQRLGRGKSFSVKTSWYGVKFSSLAS